MAVLQLAAHFQVKPLGDNHPCAITLLLYMICSPPRAFCELGIEIGKYASHSYCFKTQGKICQALLSNLLVGVLLN